MKEVLRLRACINLLKNNKSCFRILTKLDHQAHSPVNVFIDFYDESSISVRRKEKVLLLCEKLFKVDYRGHSK